MRENRAQSIIHHIVLALANATTMRSYATTVAGIYNERTAAAARGIEFHSTRDPYADERANAQIVQRYVDGRARMPVEIEEALVLALPEPFRGECKRELAARYGDLAAPIPACDGEAVLADAGKLMEECGLSIMEVAQSCRDGKIIPGKTETARKAVNDLTDVIAMSTTLREHLLQELGVPTISSTKRAG
jgi:hypothetical protein